MGILKYREESRAASSRASATGSSQASAGPATPGGTSDIEDDGDEFGDELDHSASKDSGTATRVARATRDRGVREIKEQFIKLQLAERERSSAPTPTTDNDKDTLYMDLGST